MRASSVNRNFHVVSTWIFFAGNEGEFIQMSLCQFFFRAFNHPLLAEPMD